MHTLCSITKWNSFSRILWIHSTKDRCIPTPFPRSCHIYPRLLSMYAWLQKGRLCTYQKKNILLRCKEKWILLISFLFDIFGEGDFGPFSAFPQKDDSIARGWDFFSYLGYCLAHFCIGRNAIKFFHEPYSFFWKIISNKTVPWWRLWL